MTPTQALTTPPDRHIEAPSLGGWCEAARIDPITELIAFPDFDAAFPDLMSASIRGGQCVGLAIGDVDHLKEYVETINDRDPLSFGHLAGNALMRQLGQLTVTWFHRQSYRRGCASTFGGDEVILAAEVESAEVFHAQVTQLAATLAADLPRTVSFATAVLTPPEIPPAESTIEGRRSLYLHMVIAVDRCLFAAKRGRSRQTSTPFVATATLPAYPTSGGRS